MEKFQLLGILWYQHNFRYLHLIRRVAWNDVIYCVQHTTNRALHGHMPIFPNVKHALRVYHNFPHLSHSHCMSLPFLSHCPLRWVNCFHIYLGLQPQPVDEAQRYSCSSLSRTRLYRVHSCTLVSWPSHEGMGFLLTPTFYKCKFYPQNPPHMSHDNIQLAI